MATCDILGRLQFIRFMLSAPTLPFTLTLRPAAARYAATLSWESYVNGDYQLTTIEKEVALRVQPGGTGLAVAFETSPPTLVTPIDPEPLAALALRLAALYARVLVQAAPTGKITALLNHPELVHTGTQVLLEMRAAAHEDDQLTPALLSFAERQLQSPTSVLASLQHDYLYQTLLPNFYLYPLGDAAALPRQRWFTNFFDKVALCFSEQVEVLPSATSQHLLLRLHGTLDTQQTNLTVVCEAITKALQLPQPPGETSNANVLPAPHFHYEATYTIELATGLPLCGELTLYARAGQVYNKQYALNINRL